MNHGNEKISKIGLLFLCVAIVLAIITAGIILYQKTDWMKEFIKNFCDFWERLRKWDWS